MMHSWLCPGYAVPLPFVGLLESHRLVEAMKSAFALRMHLGDPGDCSSPASPRCFLNLTALLNDTLSTDFAAALRWGCCTSAASGGSTGPLCE